MNQFLWVLVGFLGVVLISYLVYRLVKTSRTRQHGDSRHAGGGFVAFGGGAGNGGGRDGGGGDGGGGGGNGGGGGGGG